nr:histidine kinase [Terriglobus roseus]
MFFAGFNGATTFLPEAIPDSNYAPPTVITDLRLLGNVSTPVTLPQAISYTSKITLTHKQTPFTLTFAALAYSNSLTNRYRYKLEGLDTLWNEVGSDNRSVTYTNLSAKTYHFRVQGATNSSAWSDPGAELEIVILPPWWNTAWFRTSYVLLALLIIWAAYGYRMRQLADQVNIRIEAQVDERTRIARDLHDTLLQSLHALLLRLQTVLNVFSTQPEEARLRLERTIDQTAQAITEGRDTLNELRSAGSSASNLEQAVSNFARLTLSGSPAEQEPEVRVQTEGTPIPMNPVVRDEVYRIIAEAVRNSIRHANARRIEIEIRYDRQFLRVRVGDDGMGIDPSLLTPDHRLGHWGLHGMRERAKLVGGTLEVWSELSVGTEITLSIPAASVYDKSRSRPSPRLLCQARLCLCRPSRETTRPL